MHISESGEGGRGETRSGTEKRCSHSLQSDPLGSERAGKFSAVISPASTA